jgi:hypothetical protein
LSKKVSWKERYYLQNNQNNSNSINNDNNGSNNDNSSNISNNTNSSSSSNDSNSKKPKIVSISSSSGVCKIELFMVAIDKLECLSMEVASALRQYFQARQEPALRVEPREELHLGRLQSCL